MVGRFFSGEKQTVNGSTFWGGAGHLSCGSLFVIQRVEWFEPHTLEVMEKVVIRFRLLD